MSSFLFYFQYYSNEKHIYSTTLPEFNTYANDDIVDPIANSLVFYNAFKNFEFLPNCIFILQLGMFTLNNLHLKNG